METEWPQRSATQRGATQLDLRLEAWTMEVCEGLNGQGNYDMQQEPHGGKGKGTRSVPKASKLCETMRQTLSFSCRAIVTRLATMARFLAKERMVAKCNIDG